MTGRDGGADLHPAPGESPIVVLVRPQLADNIGAVARAMANGGLFHLRLEPFARGIGQGPDKIDAESEQADDRKLHIHGRAPETEALIRRLRFNSYLFNRNITAVHRAERGARR